MSNIINMAPPKLALRFFRWYCRSERWEELEGDLEEMHGLRCMRMQSKITIRLLFWWDVFKCFKRYSVNKTQLQMNTSLYKSYAKIAMRSAWKHKGPVITNVIGMGLALGYCITVYMIMAYNYEFDSFFENTDDVVRIHSFKTDNEIEKRYEMMPLPLLSQLEHDVAGVKGVTTYEDATATVQTKADYYKESVSMASSNFIEFFDFPIVAGSAASFANPNTVFLSKETAEKYYGNTSAMGELLTLHFGDNKGIEVQVGGVFDKIPLNTSFDIDILMNLAAYLTVREKTTDDWKNTMNTAVYVRTSNPGAIQSALTQSIPLQNEMQTSWKINRYEAIPFVDERVADHLIDYGPSNKRIRPQALIIFGVMGFMILMVACFNMANSSMALIAYRVKEVGVRKTLGSKNRQIFFQFIFEMFVMMSMSFVLAIALTNVIAEQIWGLFGVSFFLQDISIMRLIPFLILFAMGCTIIAGLLPALYTWKFQPISILSGNYSLKGVGFVQKMFTVGQYTFSIAVLIAGWMFAQNSDYMRDFDIGLNYEGMLVVPIKEGSDYGKLKDQIQQLSHVTKVVGTTDHHQRGSGEASVEIDTTLVEVTKYSIGKEYLATMEIEVVSGRNFIEESASDKSGAIIINEAFAKRFFEDKEPVNERIKIDDEWRTVVGVTNDVIYNLYEDFVPRPEVYFMGEEAHYRYLLAKVGDQEAAEASVKVIWAENFDTPYLGRWQEDLTLASASRDSQNLKSIFLSLATLGCFLCLLGIISLATMNVKKKTKEICIRKILGASYGQILMKVNRSFIVILLISLISGVGLGVLLSDAVMGMIYKFHIDASIMYASGIGLAVVLVAILFISLAVTKPVNANPSEGLSGNE
jgi:ABC-type antimicrobial peptide transport system permease subunit